MKPCDWEEISGFSGEHEFAKFQAWMRARVDDGSAKEVPVRSFYYPSKDARPKDWNEPGRYWHNQEKWYQHAVSGEIWRLVWPDWPAPPLFRRVPPAELETRA